MNREDLAKDILLTILPRCLEVMENEPADAWKGPMRKVSQTSVELADALLEALGAKEAPASWLSKEMRTPAKGFPAIKDTLKVGDTVELPADLPECRGLRLRGLLISFPRHGDSEVLLELVLPDTPRRQFIHVPTYRLVKVPE